MSTVVGLVKKLDVLGLLSAREGQQIKNKVEVVEDNRQEQSGNPQDSNAEAIKTPLKHAIDERIVHKTVTSRDGLTLKCIYIPCTTPGKSKTILLCSPLGFCNIFAFRPIIAKFGHEYSFINWQYRSLFESDTPATLRRCSVRDHAEDALDVMNGLGYDSVDVMIGHSMGVSVCCEFALLYPDNVGSMVMINGGHGHLFHTAFQPFFRIPFAGNISESIVNTLLNNNPKRVMQLLKDLGSNKSVESLLNFVGRKTGTPYMISVQGEGFYNEWVQMYFGGLSSDDTSANSYCRMFQELNAHSTYHLLHLIQNKCLLISGGLDYLTPPYLMKEMSSKIPDSEYHCCFLSTHLTLMENPDFVLEKMENFLGLNQETSLN